MRLGRVLGPVTALVLTVLTPGLAVGSSAAVRSHAPVGHFDIGRYDSWTNTIRVGGWAADPDLGAAPGQRVMVSIDGKDVKSLAVGTSRPDVARVHPSYGSHTGFNRSLPVPKARGEHTVCVRAINRGAGNVVSVPLGCKSFTVLVAGALIGHIDRAVYVTNGAEVYIRGWVLDPYDAISPTSFFVMGPNRTTDSVFYLESYVHEPRAVPRPDVDRRFPRNGSAHGFEVTLITKYLEDVGAYDTVCLGSSAPGFRYSENYGFEVPNGEITASSFCATIAPGVLDPP